VDPDPNEVAARCHAGPNGDTYADSEGNGYANAHLEADGYANAHTQAGRAGPQEPCRKADWRDH
jgi:hypothetical protein